MGTPKPNIKKIIKNYKYVKFFLNILQRVWFWNNETFQRPHFELGDWLIREKF